MGSLDRPKVCWAHGREIARRREASDTSDRIRVGRGDRGRDVDWRLNSKILEVPG